MGFSLAPEYAQGQYPGVLGLGFSTGQALAPAILTAVVLGLDTTGWLLLASFLTWCLLPGRARSTGLGPLLGPGVRPGRGTSRSPPSTSEAGSSIAASSAGARAVGPRRRPRSRRPGVASRSCRSRSPVPAAGTPTGCRYAARTRSRTTPAGPAPSAGPRPASALARAATARSATTVHPRRSTAATVSSPRPHQRSSRPTVT